MDTIRDKKGIIVKAGPEAKCVHLGEYVLKIPRSSMAILGNSW